MQRYILWLILYNEVNDPDGGGNAEDADDGNLQASHACQVNAPWLDIPRTAVGGLFSAAPIQVFEVKVRPRWGRGYWIVTGSCRSMRQYRGAVS